jgi:hypothetical protein
MLNKKTLRNEKEQASVIHPFKQVDWKSKTIDPLVDFFLKIIIYNKFILLAYERIL